MKTKISLLVIALFLNSCGNSELEEKQRIESDKKDLLSSFIGKKLRYVAWSPTDISYEGDSKRGSYVSEQNPSFMELIFSSDSTFSMEVKVEDYRQSASSLDPEMIRKTGSWKFVGGKIILGEPLYFPVKAFDGLSYKKFESEININLIHKSLALTEISLKPAEFSSYRGANSALTNSSLSDNAAFEDAKSLFEGKQNSNIDVSGIFTSYIKHFKPL